MVLTFTEKKFWKIKLEEHLNIIIVIKKRKNCINLCINIIFYGVCKTE